MKNRDSIIPSPVWVIAVILGAVLAVIGLFVVGVLGLIYAIVGYVVQKHRTWYWSSVERARRHIEHKARRFNGDVTWRE